MKKFFPNRRSSIRGDLLRPLIISFLCAMIFMASMLIVQSQKMVEQVLIELQGEMLTMMDREINTRLGEAVQLSRISHDAMKNDLLNLEEFESRERFFAMMIKNYTNITMSYVGLPSGEFYAARRNIDGSIDIGRNNQSTAGNSEYYRIDEYGSADYLIQTFENYDPRIRPWYIAAEESKKLIFSSVYSHFLFKEPTITASMPYYKDEKLVGVFGVDLLLTWLGESLKDLPIGNSGLVYILDQEGQFVATTTDNDIFELVDNKSVTLSINDIDNVLISSTVSEKVSFTENIRIDNELYMVSKLPYTYENLDWSIYIVLLRDDFLLNLNKTLAWTFVLIFIFTALFIVATFSIVKRIVNPIIKLNEATKKLEKGVYVELNLDTNKNELYELNKSFNLMGQQIIHQVEILEGQVASRTKELEEKNLILNDLSYIDPLLNIANRRRFDENGSLMYELAIRNKMTFTIMMIDIDNFKMFNDTYGHVEGDKCLIKIASVMQNALSRKTDLLARFGGEEFVVALTNLSSEQVLVCAENIRLTVEELKIENKMTDLGYTTVSVGIAHVEATKVMTIEQIVTVADQAMYDAKIKGRNCCQINDYTL